MASALPWADVNQHNAKRAGVAPLTFWKGKDHLGHGITIA